MEELLTNMGQGMLSVHRVGSLAREAARMCGDGALEDLGACTGKNAERALHRWVRRQTWSRILPELYPFALTKRRTEISSAGAVYEGAHAAILPHEIVATLSQNAPEMFEYLFGSAEERREFWKAARERAIVGVADHPVLETEDEDSSRVVPIGAHGDDAGVSQGGAKVMVLSFNSLCSPCAATLDNRIVVTMLRVQEMVPGNTEPTVINVLRWSFECMAAGVFPHADHAGTPFSSQHHPSRARLAGRPLTSAGLRFAFCELRGDWKCLRESLHLSRHYGAEGLCHMCGASKAEGPMRYTNFSKDAPYHATIRGHDEFVAENPSAWLRIPGFHVRHVTWDCMHALDLGVYQIIVSSVLAELTRFDNQLFDGGRCEDRLAMAYREYGMWCRMSGEHARAQQFNLAWVSGDFPSINQRHARAAAMLGLLRWLHGVALRRLYDPQGRRRALMLEKFVKAEEIIRSHPRFLPAAAHAEYGQCMEAALLLANACAHGAAQMGRNLYRLTPKFHVATHLAWDTQGVNPRRTSCFPDEDMVGRMKRLYMRCHASTAPTTALLRYRILLGVRWNAKLVELRL
ncbi:MAG: hypothetical protein GY772_01780 [bacterium]|nr:hypothetical protein [bacterium]